MAKIDLTTYLPVDNTTSDANAIADALLAVQSAVNNLDDTNIASTAAIAPSKLANYPTDATKFLRGDGTWATASPTLQTWATLVDVVNTTTESDLFGTQGSGWTIPANTLGSTDEIVLDLDGDLTIANATTPTTRFRLYLGGVVVVDTGAIGILTGVGTPHPFRSQIVVTMRGSTTSYFARWNSVFANVGAANNLTTGWGTAGLLSTSLNGGLTEWTTAGDLTLDMTQAQAIRATVAWGTASASNELRIRQAKAMKF